MLHLALMGMSPNRAGRQALPALVQQFHLDSPLVIVTAAFLLRVLLILVLRTFRLPHDFGFAFEIGSVARSVAEGDGFSSPFGAPTGPTAFAAPVYVYLLAGIFKIFGVYTNASALTALLLDSLFSGLTCWPARPSTTASASSPHGSGPSLPPPSTPASATSGRPASPLSF